jgi:hypothetical protein
VALLGQQREQAVKRAARAPGHRLEPGDVLREGGERQGQPVGEMPDVIGASRVVCTQKLPSRFTDRGQRRVPPPPASSEAVPAGREPRPASTRGVPFSTARQH